MDKQVWLSPRALRLHAVILVLVPGFMALCIWQLTRAVGGNSLSWAYVFEWPIFAAYAVYMWWRIVHEPITEVVPDPVGADATATNGTGPDATVVAADAKQAAEDADLAAYNEYLAQLAARDEAAGR
jgi:DNA-binding transcriptional regulator of glucitol operon